MTMLWACWNTALWLRLHLLGRACELRQLEGYPMSFPDSDFRLHCRISIKLQLKLDTKSLPRASDWKPPPLQGYQ